MKAILYEIQITRSTMDFVHGVSETISEIYIPKLKIFFNEEAIAKVHHGRYKKAKKIKTFEIKQSEANYIQQIVRNGTYLDRIRSKYFTDTQESS